MTNERIPDYATTLKVVRTMRGLKQKELAERMDVHPSTISLWETGERQFSLAHLTSAAVALGVPNWFLMSLAETTWRTLEDNYTQRDWRRVGACVLGILCERHQSNG